MSSCFTVFCVFQMFHSENSICNKNKYISSGRNRKTFSLEIAVTFLLGTFVLPVLYHMYVTLYRCVYTRCRGHNLLSTPPEHRKPIIVFLPRANTFWKSHPPRVQAPRPRPRPPIVSFSWRLESARGARPKHQCNLFDCQRVILGCLKNPKKKKTTKGQKEVNTMGHCPRPHTPPTTYQTLSRVVPMNNPRPTK
jgi:hypothetical protein